MSDFGAVPPREEPHDGAHDAVRDALPALLHGRVTATERADVERHLAHCAACDAELQLLASARALYTAPAPTLDVDRIAATVRARTVAAPPAAPPHDAFVVRTGAVSAHRRSTLPTWTRTGALRAVAATALLAIGSGALLYRQPAVAPTRPAVVVAEAPSTSSPRPADRDPSGTLLGASFADLSDSELAAVVAAVADPASSTPAAEPAPVAPSVLSPDGE